VVLGVRTMGLYKFDGKMPRIHPSAYVSSRASVIGDVEIGDATSVWEFAVIRADMNKIRIGKNTSIQDNCTVHCTFVNPTTIGDLVTAGHNSVIHACEIGNQVVVGIGAIVLNGAKVGDGSVIGAGAVVTENTQIPPDSLVLGIPGKVIKEVSPEMHESFKTNAEMYVALGKKHKQESERSKQSK